MNILFYLENCSKCSEFLTSLPGLIHGLESSIAACSHFLKRGRAVNEWTFAQWWKIERIFCLARGAFPTLIPNVKWNHRYLVILDPIVFSSIFKHYTIYISMHLPIEELMAHHIMLITLFCQSFRLGQDTSLNDLKSRLLIPLLKCLERGHEINFYTGMLFVAQSTS